MRIYDDQFMVGRILEKCTVDSRDTAYNDARVVDGVDLDALSDIVQRIPVDRVRARRQRLNQLYEEVLVSADPDLGVSFHTCLMVLAHHNVINDSKSLRLEEFLRRRVRLQRVDEAVRRNTVIGFFDTLYWTRKLRERISERRVSRLDTVPRFDVPEILVDNQDSDSDESDTRHDGAVMGSSEMASDRASGGDEESSPMLSPKPDSAAADTTPSRPSRRHGKLLRIDTGISSNRTSGASSSSNNSRPSEWASISPSLSPNRDERYGSGDETIAGAESTSAAHSRQNSAMSAQDMMQSLDSSAWGVSIRRSFTQRRRPHHQGIQSSPANRLG